MSINYRTFSKQKPDTGKHYPLSGDISPPCLVWPAEDHGPYIAHYEPRRGVWNNFDWRCAKPVNDDDRWVWVEELEPGYN